MSVNNLGMNIYKRHRFPPQFISYAVWLYHRFSLSCVNRRSLPSIPSEGCQPNRSKAATRWVMSTQVANRIGRVGYPVV